MKIRHLGIFLLLASCWGCSASSPSSQMTGSLQFKVKNPRFHQTQAGFGVQAIPADTRALQVRIEGEGLPEPRIETLHLDTGTSEKSFKAEQLPLGAKTVSVQAFNEAYALAGDATKVTILPGATTRAVLELKSILQGVKVLLAASLPTALSLDLEISGEGVLPGQVIKRQLQVNPGETALQLGDLPPGEKVVKVLVPLGGQAVPLLEQALTVREGENVLSLALADKLRDLHQQALQNPAGELGHLRQQVTDLLNLDGNPEPGTALDSLKERLTQEVQAGLREEIKERLIGPLPTSGDSSGEQTEGMDILNTGLNKGGSVLLLNDSETLVIPRSTRVYGIGSQIAYGGEDAPAFEAVLTHNEREEVRHAWKGGVRKLLGDRFQAYVDLAQFDGSEKNLPAGYYTLAVRVYGEKGETSRRYQIQLEESADSGAFFNGDGTKTKTDGSGATFSDPATATVDNGDTSATGQESSTSDGSTTTTDGSTAGDTTSDGSNTDGTTSGGLTTGGDSSSGGSGSTTLLANDPRTYPVTIDTAAGTLDGASFSVDSLSLKVGDAISWQNNTQLAKYVSNGSDVSPAIEQGNTFQFEFKVAGSYSVVLKNRLGTTLDSMTVIVN